ncbi:MAG: hypothetical protein JXQ23_00525 [Clostridia bacterium]|nr:hypothetical protein [Clostridia bacterium]
MSSVLSSFVTGMGIFYTILRILFFIGFYLLFSYGLFTIANKRGDKNAILAWIPIANFYLLGTFIGDFDIAGKPMKNVEVLLPVAVVLYYVFGSIWYIGYLLAAVCLLFIIYALYTYYRNAVPEKALFYTIISAILPTISIPVIFFLIKDK